MRDCRKQLVKGLVTAINNVLSGISVYTIVPKNVTYPYIYISDIYQNESGPKTSYFYDYDVLVQVVYKDLTSKTNIYNSVNSILSIINNGTPFTLTDNFKIYSCELLSNNDTQILTDTGILDVGLIRIGFLIEDLI